MKVWNLLRNPISIFALFATLVLIKSDIFRDVSVSLTKTFSFRERQEAAYELLVTWRPVMPSQIHIQYPYKTTKLTVLRDGLNTHPQGHTYADQQQKLLEIVLFCCALKSTIHNTFDTGTHL